MRRRATFWLAWSLAALSLAMFIAGVLFALMALYVASPAGWASSDWSFSSGFGESLIFLPFLAFPVVGALTASRRPGNAIGWICLVAGLFWMSFFLDDQSTAYEFARTGTVTSSVTVDALTQASWVLPVGLLGVYMILLFPDGRLPSRRWRPFAWFAGAVMVLINVIFALVPGTLEGHPGVRNPFGLEQYPWMANVAVFVVVMLPLCILASALSLVLRYRRSGGEVREQIKWLAFAASVVGLVYLGGLIGGLFFTPESLTTNETPPLWLSLWQHLTLISYAGVPTAIGIAILKYRLYDIDIIINRTLVYVSLTATLAVLYFAGVAATQTVFRTLTGEEQQPQLAIVVSTLAIAALFGPLRRRIQNVIDRRFYRRKYDAARTLEAFSARLRNETDLSTLSDDLVSVVRETLQPEHASVWLRSPEGERPVKATELKT